MRFYRKKKNTLSSLHYCCVIHATEGRVNKRQKAEGQIRFSYVEPTGSPRNTASSRSKAFPGKSAWGRE